jgi:hypothetical protein
MSEIREPSLSWKTLKRADQVIAKIESGQMPNYVGNLKGLKAFRDGLSNFLESQREYCIMLAENDQQQ